jgi:hypothetical protein
MNDSSELSNSDSKWKQNIVHLYLMAIGNGFPWGKAVALENLF